MSTRWRARPDAQAEAEVLADEARERARRTGEILRQSRAERGITLADVEEDIRINRAYLEALEQARFDLLPAPVYARGFMRSYARYLGLDPEEAARAIPRDLPRPAELDPLPGLRRAGPSTLPALPALRVLRALQNLSPPMLLGLGVVVLAVLVGVLFAPRLIGIGGGGSTTPTPTATGTAPAAIDAPNLVGQTREAATAAIERAGLTPLVFEASNSAPPGTVFRQSPGAGTPVRRGDVITLFVSQAAAPSTPAASSPTPTATPR